MLRFSSVEVIRFPRSFDFACNRIPEYKWKWGRASFGGLRSLPGFFQGFVLGALFED